MVDLSFSMSELEYFLLVLVRIASFVFIAPFFSTKGVPNNVKIGLSVFVAYIIYYFGPEHTYPEYHTLLGFCTIVLEEVSVGLLVGLGA